MRVWVKFQQRGREKPASPVNTMNECVAGFSVACTFILDCSHHFTRDWVQAPASFKWMMQYEHTALLVTVSTWFKEMWRRTWHVERSVPLTFCTVPQFTLLFCRLSLASLFRSAEKEERRRVANSSSSCTLLPVLSVSLSVSLAHGVYLWKAMSLTQRHQIIFSLACSQLVYHSHFPWPQHTGAHMHTHTPSAQCTICCQSTNNRKKNAFIVSH